MFTSIILFSMGEGFCPRLATAQEYKAKGYWDIDLVEFRGGWPSLLELYSLIGGIGYGPFLIESGFGGGKIFPGEWFTSYLPLNFYLIPYAKIEKGRAIFPTDFSLSKVFYLYGGGSAWASSGSFILSSGTPARYFDCGLGFYFYALDFRFGFFTGRDYWGETSTTFYASIGLCAKFWGAYGVKKVSQ